MEYSSIYKEIIEKGNLRKYIKKHGEEIFHQGTHELVAHKVGEDWFWINLDVQDDLKTPVFHVRINSDADLETFGTFDKAFIYYMKRINKQEQLLLEQKPNHESDEIPEIKPPFNKEELISLLKENLSIELRNHRDYEGEGFELIIKFEDEKICSDTFITKQDNYY